MPIDGNKFGNLYIDINIIFPNQISDQRKEYLKKLLPNEKKQSDTSNSTIVDFEIIKKDGINENYQKDSYSNIDDSHNTECSQQ